MSFLARSSIWLLIALFVGQTCAFGQGRKKREVTPARLEKLIRAATQGSPVVRPQAAQRLMKMGPVAHDAVLDHIASKTDLFAVGPELLEVAAALALPGDAETAALRVQFWKQVAQRDFPWRAALVSGLGKNPQASERDRFVELLGDRMLAVRLAALKRFSVGESVQLLPILQARLQVETEGVARRALARRAVEAGHANSLWVLYGELARNDYFFDQPVGLIARLEAARDLKALLPEGPAFDAQAPVDSESSVEQRAAWLAYLEPLAGPRPVPVEGRLQPAGEPLLGIELRSCRRGEFFLRWTSADQLWMGRGKARCFQLAEGTHKSLVLAAQGALAAMGDKRLVGQPGCDQESYHFRLPGSARSSVYLITKGPQPVADLRPLVLHPLLRELLATLESADVPSALAQELSEALVDLGGEYRR